MDKNFSLEAYDLLCDLEMCFRIREEIPVVYSEDKRVGIYLDYLVCAEEKKIWEQIKVLLKEDNEK